MKVIRREWTGISRADEFTIIPLGDVHLGNAACDEGRFRSVVDRITNDNRAYWIGMGDYCLPLDAQILTRDGWRHWDEISRGDEVLAFDGENTTWTPLLGIYMTLDAELWRFKSKSFETVCTPNHGWIVNDTHGARRKGKKQGSKSWPRKVAAKNLKKHHRILTAARCDDAGQVAITEDEATLLGWLVTDGFVTTRSANSFIAGIAQSKEPYRSRIRERFADWFTKEYVNDQGQSTFNLSVPVIRDLFGRLGLEPKTLNGQLATLVTRMPPRARRAMFQAMTEAEGWQEREHWRFSQQPGPILEAYEILATLEGERLGLGKYNEAGVKTLPLMGYRRHVGVADLTTEKMGRGPAWCPQTLHGSWVTKQGNQITITGNCDFINRRDPRFTVDSLASWVTVRDMADLAGAQARRFLEIVKPIAGRCLCLIEGNHERAILKHYERDIYSDIIGGVKHHGGFPADTKLALGVAGWLVLSFARSDDGKSGRSVIRFNLHHGFVGGKLAGAKALNMQRWLWNHRADVVVFGHSHNTSVQLEAVEVVRGNSVLLEKRIGCYGGTFMSGAQYAMEKGYFPLPLAHTEIILKPGAEDYTDRIRVVSGC